MGRVIVFPNGGAEGTRALVALYSLTEAARLARVPRHRLYEWTRLGIVFPSITVRSEDSSEERYSFDALVYVRLLRMLRESELGITLPRAVEAVKSLVGRWGPPGPAWADARIFLDGRDIYIESADPYEVTVASKQGARPGQKVATELFGEEFARLRERADSLLVPAEYQPYVEIDPLARSGMPIVLGTTLQTATIYSLHNRGLSESDIEEHYPFINPEQIRAAINFERTLDAAA